MTSDRIRDAFALHGDARAAAASGASTRLEMRWPMDAHGVLDGAGDPAGRAAGGATNGAGSDGGTCDGASGGGPNGGGPNGGGNGAEADGGPAARYHRLTARERDVLRLIAEGYSAPEIGELLSISAKTVDTYKHRINEKLGVTHRTEYVRLALRLGILKP